VRAAVLWAALLATSAAAETPAVVVLKAARLIDGRGGAPLAPAMVRVDGDRIADVGSRLAVPSGARVVDLGDATLLPGLIDLHTHLTDKFGVHWEQALVSTTPGQAALWGAANARATLMAGFTTCRDMGPTWPYVDVDLRNVIEQGGVPGPRLLVAGNYVSSTGGANCPFPPMWIPLISESWLSETGWTPCASRGSSRAVSCDTVAGECSRNLIPSQRKR